MRFILFFVVLCNCYYTDSECSTSTDGGSNCYTNCSPNALRYYGTCNYVPYCNFVALNANYNCVPSYVILPNGSFSYYVAGIYVTGGVGYLQSGTCQFCNSVAVGGALDVSCFDSEVGGPWTNAQKRRTATSDDDEDSEEFISNVVIETKYFENQNSNSNSNSNSFANINSYKSNIDVEKKRTKNLNDNNEEAKIRSKPKNYNNNNNNFEHVLRSDDKIEEKEDRESLCNLFGFCDPSWGCKLAGSSMSNPINLSSCCFALINLNNECACSPIAAALGLYPLGLGGLLGFICSP